MKKTILIIFVSFVYVNTSAQQSANDTATTLGEIVVRAFEQNRQLKESAVAMNYVNQQQLERFNNISILPALNNTPGVRMEERSPGSYRMNIRGSTLRSPFGVRNVKIYWNNIPFTDPGGGTYLNQLGYYDIRSIEVIKGPAGSLYGAGTGGVILLNSDPVSFKPGVSVSYTAGSFGLSNGNIQARFGEEDHHHTVSYTRQNSDGYRDHSRMRRDVVSWQTQVSRSERQQLSASLMYGDLYYQTPGALTRAEFTANPRGARPAAGAFPSAAAAKAAIYQKTFLAGINHAYKFTDQFSNSTVIYGAFSQITNPTFRNYERRSEPHFGGRSVFTWKKDIGNSDLQIVFGGEGQRGFFNTKTYANSAGNPGAVMTDDDINNWLYSGFVQADLRLPQDWNITAGASINRSSITIARLSVPGFTPVKRTYDSEWAPRLAISKKVIGNVWLYASISRGFSPPTGQEILPSTSVISTGLEAEQGTSYETGIKSTWLKNRLYIEVNTFSYQLKNAIVQRRDLSNADYFDNAGSTRQKGIESQVNYHLIQGSGGCIRDARIWITHTLNDFRYNDFKQGTNDFSGNRLPSVARNTVTSGFDLTSRPGLYMNMTYFYSDRIALNDANTEYANGYHLLGGRLGWKKMNKKNQQLDLFVGAENILDTEYSLGNDINAAGGRFFNAAATRSLFGGVALKF